MDIKKYIRLLMLVLVAMMPLAAAANYTVDSVEGKVTVSRGGNESEVTRGMKLNVNDRLTIAPGAKITIYNALTKELYTSTTAGRTDVTSLMFNARSQASSSNIISKARVTPRSSGNTRAYTQGSVKRALTLYDPEGASVNADPTQIAMQVWGVMNGTAVPRELTVEVKSDSAGTTGRGFTVSNPLPYPIYINALRLSRSKAGGVELSQLGQPTGCYVLLPGQSISRSQAEGIDPEEAHFLVITHYQFDVDEVLTALEGLRDKSIHGVPEDDSLEVYIAPVR
ncbi:MAG: hypothetical protein K2M19_04640 [Muribaculaceae bacterium]|nr:hypothetical protein [Muribaculaceae bacterium]